MKGIILLLLLGFILLVCPVYANNGAKVDTHDPKVGAIASKGIYNGKKCLVITLKDGKVPINAPSKRLKLLSDKNNDFKSFSLTQISPGKYVTTDAIRLQDSYFKLRFLNCSRIKDIEINFKEK